MSYASNVLTEVSPREIFTTSEAASFLKLGKSTLEQLRLKGGGPSFVRFGPKTIRYRYADLMAWGRTYSSTSEYRIQT